MSPRRNWDSPNPSRQLVCPSPPEPKGGWDTRHRVRGWWSPNSNDWRKSVALWLLGDSNCRGKYFNCRWAVGTSYSNLTKKKSRNIFCQSLKIWLFQKYIRWVIVEYRCCSWQQFETDQWPFHAGMPFQAFRTVQIMPPSPPLTSC
jgi:hypothetical protein